ncbi:MAG: alanine--tRNA ligase-related protein, partial [Patescibacteria group bacterium]
FFEMLGNFSFGYKPGEPVSPKGGYGKVEAITYAYEFITKELGLKISYVTIFGGELTIPKDEASRKVWAELGVSDIREEGMKDVFWGPTGASGPCGPTTEIYCQNANGQNVEIWNIVFNEYFCPGTREQLLNSASSIVLDDLKNKGIDTGMGLERLTMIMQGKKNIFDTDLFANLIAKIKELSPNPDERAIRIIADHLRAGVMLLADGVLPANTDRGYVLRRLLRRAVRYADLIKLAPDGFSKIIDVVIGKYGTIYPEVLTNKENLPDGKAGVKSEIENEEQKFRKTLRGGLAKLSKVISYNLNTSDPILREKISGREAFDLYQTHGFPMELVLEEASRNGLKVDEEEFKKLLTEHQVLSRAGAEQKFKGGLADNSPETIKLHTAHHLLLAALQQVLGKEVKQRGSNITSERLRIDFSFSRKLTAEELIAVEKIVNEKIQANLKVERREMPKTEAEKLGAEMEFGAKYGDTVSVYFIGDPDARSGQAFSLEFCGGPHVAFTGEIGGLKIIKEEAVASGVRRIKANLVL